MNNQDLIQSEAYKNFFIIENSLRVAMHNILVAKKGVSYFSINVFPKFKYVINGEEKEIDLVSQTIARKNEEKKYKEKMGCNFPYLWYLEYPILLSMLDKFWKDYFAELFDNNKNIKTDLIYRLTSLKTIRNSIAHNRSLLRIDISEITSCFDLLQSSLRKDYLHNYNKIVFNEIEDKRASFIETCNNILKKIMKYVVVPKPELRTFREEFSALIQALEKSDEIIDNFNEVNTIIENYNKQPRQPGVSEEIKNFIKGNCLIEKINQMKRI